MAEVEEQARPSNREVERDRGSWRKTVAVVEVATGVRLGQMARRRLTRQERAQLVELSAKVERDNGVDVGRLSRDELPVWEWLVEKAARRPGLFTAAREEKEARTLAREMAKIATELRKPRRRVDLHEAGSVTLAKEWVFDWFAEADPDPILWISHVGLLVFLLAQFENGATVIPGAYFETDADGVLVLYIPKAGFGSAFDDDEQRLGWRDRLEHLAANDFFTVERSGGYLKVKLGSRLRRIEREAA